MRIEHAPKTYLLLAALLGCFNAACRTSPTGDDNELLFYGKDNQSAKMSFDSYIEVAIPQGVRNAQDVMTGTNKRKMQSIADYQVQHLFGVFTEHPEYVENPGIVSTQQRPVLQSAELNTQAGLVKVFYSYTDTAVFKKKLLRDGNRDIKFVLPKDPTTIYSKGFTPGGSLNKCTDEHYNSEGDFWYFWNPKKRGCPIKPEDLVEVTARVEPIANTIKTYPYYNALLGDNGNGRTVSMTYLVGIDHDFRAGDLGRRTFQEALLLLAEKEFVLDESQSTAYSKRLTYHKRDWDVELWVKLVDPGSPEFVQSAAKSMENDDVFIYDGHSGLGGYLNLERFEHELGRKLKLPKEKSQIFFFNGCSTFAYYNHDYFKLKATETDPQGIKNLDVITTSIGASFDIGARHDVVLINGISNGSRPSWQLLMDRMYRVDRYQSALTHVNGDEDNPSVPR